MWHADWSVQRQLEPRDWTAAEHELTAAPLGGAAVSAIGSQQEASPQGRRFPPTRQARAR